MYVVTAVYKAEHIGGYDEGYHHEGFKVLGVVDCTLDEAKALAERLMPLCENYTDLQEDEERIGEPIEVSSIVKEGVEFTYYHLCHEIITCYGYESSIVITFEKVSNSTIELLKSFKCY